MTQGRTPAPGLAPANPAGEESTLHLRLADGQRALDNIRADLDPNPLAGQRIGRRPQVEDGDYAVAVNIDVVSVFQGGVEAHPTSSALSTSLRRCCAKALARREEASKELDAGRLRGSEDCRLDKQG